MPAPRSTLARLAAFACLAGLTFPLAACSGTPQTTGDAGAARGTDPPVVIDLQGRSYVLKVPAGYSAKQPAALVVMMHGFTNDPDPGAAMDAYMHVSPETEKRGILLAIPLGTLDKVLKNFSWNATDACCGWDTQANDIGYLLAMIEQIQAKYSVDPKRIYAFGHSNGGFMAHRLACDQADRFAGIVSLAGEVYKDPSRCAASAPIAVLQVQGDADTTVPYGGGSPYEIGAIPKAPGAVETSQIWAAKNLCDPTPDTSQPNLDLAADLPGAETARSLYTGCEANGATELWTLHGAAHSPDFNASWAGQVLDFLMAHPKP